MTKQEWYKQNNCTHAHCPCLCDHPQPMIDGEDLICGACLFGYRDGSQRTLMIPCNPETCID